MNIEEVREARRALETELLTAVSKAVNAFQNETGVRVDNVVVQTSSFTPSGAERRHVVITGVEVRLERL